MGESLLLITIVALVVLAIRRGKPVVLDNPVIIHRRGQYHITLAPQLNRAQPSSRSPGNLCCCIRLTGMAENYT